MMDVGQAKYCLSQAIKFAQRACDAEDDTTIRIWLGETLRYIEDVLFDLDDSELVSEMVANERFGHPRHLKAE